MRFLESLLYGLFSGLAEFLPVSMQAHQALCMQLFGVVQREPLRDLFVHIALIIALFQSAKSMFDRINREKKLSTHAGRNKMRYATMKSLQDLRLVRTAAIPMILLLLGYFFTGKLESKPGTIAIFMVLNGAMLIIPEYMRHGNKDARSISASEAVLLGAISGLSVFPGISRIAGCISASTICGADRQNGISWALLLSVPALFLYTIVDLVNMIAIGFPGLTFLVFLGYLISAITAYFSGYFSVLLLRFLSDKAGFAAFAYYSWGAALFMFVLYLIT